MKKGYFLKLAFNNIAKNRRLYVPQMITGIGLLSVMYILFTLKYDDKLSEIKGGAYIPTVMSIGIAVVGILSIVLMLYTNSFLMKQRKREYGLYNVLGMGKKHIVRIMGFENLATAIVTFIGGYVTGMVFYKFCTLIICKLFNVENKLGQTVVDGRAIMYTGIIFAGIFIVNFIYNAIQIGVLKPVELLHSNHFGEKEPKVKWLIFITGLVTMGTGYYIALSVKSPLKALMLFFIAVILVVLGTYFLFTAGSIAILKALKKNKRFYYHPKHMTAVSGLIYRMKQNAMGLASICILSTCVLVMISTTVSLYSGTEETLNSLYPKDVKFSAGLYMDTDEGDIKGQNVNINTLDCGKEVGVKLSQEAFHKACEKYNVKVTDIDIRRQLITAYVIEGKSLKGMNPNDVDYNYFDQADKICSVAYVTIDEYNEIMGTNYALGENEIYIYKNSANSVKLSDEVKIEKRDYKIVRELNEFPADLTEYQFATVFGIVLPNEEQYLEMYQSQKEIYGANASEIQYTIFANFPEGISDDTVNLIGKEYYSIASSLAQEYISTHGEFQGGYSTRWDSRAEMSEYMYGLYGSLFFLGIFLGIVFIFATALIIYYKQISEGYEDRNRFQIMTKVGMSKKEIKGTIRSQIILVFLFPLIVAGVHMTVAFPILTKLLHVLFIPRDTIFLICTICSFVAFSLIYLAIYSITARTYYKIVR